MAVGTGLDNTSSLCYLNASVQCLSSIPTLRDIFLASASHGAPTLATGLVSKAFQDLLMLLHSPARHASVSSLELKAAVAANNVQFRNDSQQDAQELLSFLIDCLHVELNKVTVCVIV